MGVFLHNDCHKSLYICDYILKGSGCDHYMDHFAQDIATFLRLFESKVRQCSHEKFIAKHWGHSGVKISADRNSLKKVLFGRKTHYRSDVTKCKRKTSI